MLQLDAGSWPEIQIEVTVPTFSILIKTLMNGFLF